MAADGKPGVIHGNLYRSHFDDVVFWSTLERNTTARAAFSAAHMRG